MVPPSLVATVSRDGPTLDLGFLVASGRLSKPDLPGLVREVLWHCQRFLAKDCITGSFFGPWAIGRL